MRGHPGRMLQRTGAVSSERIVAGGAPLCAAARRCDSRTRAVYHHGSRTRAGGRGGGELDKTAGASAPRCVGAKHFCRRGRCAGADDAKPRTAKRQPIARWGSWCPRAASAVLQRPALAVRVICLRAATSMVRWSRAWSRAARHNKLGQQRCVPAASWWEERWSGQPWKGRRDLSGQRSVHAQRPVAETRAGGRCRKTRALLAFSETHCEVTAPQRQRALPSVLCYSTITRHCAYQSRVQREGIRPVPTGPQHFSRP